MSPSDVRRRLALAQQARREAVGDLRDATEDEEDTKRIAVVAAAVASAVRQSSHDLYSDPPAAKSWHKFGRTAKTVAAAIVALGAVVTAIKTLLQR